MTNTRSNPKSNTAMADKLNKALEQSTGFFTGTKKGVDGVDHINIGRGARTHLGRWLNQHSEGRFRHNILGYFNSIDRIRIYLGMSDKDDSVRACPPGVAITRLVKASKRIRVINLQAILLDAHWQRLMQNPTMLSSFKASTAVFTSYDTSFEFPLIREQNAFIMPLLRGLEEIRTAIKEGRDPDLLRFYDNEQRTIHSCIVESLGLSEDDAAAIAGTAPKARSVTPIIVPNKPKKKKTKVRKERSEVVAPNIDSSISSDEGIDVGEVYGCSDECQVVTTSIAPHSIDAEHY